MMLYVIRRSCSECLGITERKGAKFICTKCGKVEKPRECGECEELENAKALAIQNYVLMQDKHKAERDLTLLAHAAIKLKLERDRSLELLREVSHTTGVPPDLTGRIKSYMKIVEDC